MQKLFKFSENEITVDTEIVYSGKSDLSFSERLVRKAIGLPVTKQLIYYTDKSVDSVVPVSSYRVIEFFPEWCIVEVTLTNGETRIIHSSFLAEMQKPSFVADMARQAGALSTDEIGKESDEREEERRNKTREYKGKSINKHIDNYCVVDLETTGVYVSFAEIIEISAIKVRNNQVIDEFSTLVNPHCHIPEEATAVNHITDEMVKSAPCFADVIDSFLRFVEDDVIVGYNNASFDMNLLYDKIWETKSVSFSNDFIDLLHATRRCLERLENYKLNTICNYYGLDTEGEHRALKDCYLTRSCYEKLYAEFGDAAFRKRSRSFQGNGIQYSSETLALQELQKYLEKILKDGEIALDEVDSLRFWLEEHRDLSGNYPFDKAFNALDNILEDGKITQAELDDLKIVFLEIIDPVKSNSCHEEIQSLQNKHICLTGEFAFGSKELVAELVLDAGGVLDKFVKKSTDYLVVGANGSDAWKTGNYGGKIQKAMDYIAKGATIKLIEEKDFIPRVQYLIANPEKSKAETEEEYDVDTTDGFIYGSWKTSIQSMLDELVVEKELPEKSLYIMENYGRDGQRITSYSICIYEPDYPVSSNTKKDPARSSIVLNIKDAKGKLELLVASSIYDNIGEAAGADVKYLKSDELNTHVILPTDAESLIPYIQRITEYALDHYKPKAASFGCCGKLVECSDAKRCLHENKLYSKACMYRTSLESGRIFYGENRNID